MSRKQAKTDYLQQVDDTIRVTRDYLTRNFAELIGYKIERSMHSARIVPYTYFHRRLSRQASFRNDRVGSTVAIKRCIQILINSGDFEELPKSDGEARFHTTARCIVVKNPTTFLDKELVFSNSTNIRTELTRLVQLEPPLSSTVHAQPRANVAANMLKRIESLEKGLADALKLLAQLQHGPAPLVNSKTIAVQSNHRLHGALSWMSSQQRFPSPGAGVNPVNQTVTLRHILLWMASQDRTPAAELKQRLLPLDLLSNAVIDAVNERALDVVGDIALKEQSDYIAIDKDVLNKVLLVWDGSVS